ncbi:unnamed protein product [Symbiodinium natans]|uniref:Uncharacterized protein n=1 Tax=Symbiodinium natans TaxID=878477 RepID=A0A812L3B9_9DINO|nr:unnamed protein product [Symbiodinium natans]
MDTQRDVEPLPVTAKTPTNRALKDGDTICLLARTGCFLGICEPQDSWQPLAQLARARQGKSASGWIMDVQADFADGASPQCAFVLRTTGSRQVLDRGEITLQHLASSQVLGHRVREVNPQTLVSTSHKFDVSVDCRLFVEKVTKATRKLLPEEHGPLGNPSMMSSLREASAWMADGVDLKPVAVALARSVHSFGPGCWENVARALPIYFKAAVRSNRRKAALGLFPASSPPYTLVERQDRALEVVADLADTPGSGSSPSLVLVDGVPFLLSRDAELEAAKQLEATKNKTKTHKARPPDTAVVYRSSEVPIVTLDGEYFASMGLCGGHSLLTTAPNGTVALLCRLPRSIVKEQKREVWAGRPRYGKSAAYVVTVDVASLRNRGLKLEHAVLSKTVSGECQCGPPLVLSMTSRTQKAQLQLRPKVFNVFGLAEVAVCLVFVDHSIISQDCWRLLGYMSVTVRQQRGVEAFLASAARLVAELGTWQDQLPVAHASSAHELVREAREDILRMVTEELSKPSFDRELPFFEGELKQSGSKAEPRKEAKKAPGALPTLTPLTPLASEGAAAPGLAELRRQIAERVETLLLHLREAPSHCTVGSYNEP